jgi:hypothetical protein
MRGCPFKSTGWLGASRPVAICRSFGTTTQRARANWHPRDKQTSAWRAAGVCSEAAEKPEESMANILVNIEKGIEVGAEDILKWLMRAEKALKTTPQVIAALAVLAAALEKPLLDAGVAASNPLNIVLDVETAVELKAAWPSVKIFLATLGVKF